MTEARFSVCYDIAARGFHVHLIVLVICFLWDMYWTFTYIIKNKFIFWRLIWWTGGALRLPSLECSTLKMAYDAWVCLQSRDIFPAVMMPSKLLRSSPFPVSKLQHSISVTTTDSLLLTKTPNTVSLLIIFCQRYTTHTHTDIQNLPP
jgi:hypothetical protein